MINNQGYKLDNTPSIYELKLVIYLLFVLAIFSFNTSIAACAENTSNLASFSAPTGIATDSKGNIYVADTGNNTIRKITPLGVVTTFAGPSSSFRSPSGVAFDSKGNIYVADNGNDTICKITPDRILTTFAGAAGFSGHEDGPPDESSFNHPIGIATDNFDNVYVAEYGNNTVRKITKDGVVSTFVGSTGIKGHNDGIGAEASFNDSTTGIATDISGNVYVADSGNSIIRKISPEGIVTTFAGKAEVTGHDDGNGSAARFNYPNGIAIDSFGNVYVADTGNNVIRKITQNGLVTTFAGIASIKGGHDDGTGSLASFNNPWGVATDGSDNVYVSDRDNNTIRKISSAGVVTTFAGTVGIAGNLDSLGIAPSTTYPPLKNHRLQFTPGLLVDPLVKSEFLDVLKLYHECINNLPNKKEELKNQYIKWKKDNKNILDKRSEKFLVEMYQAAIIKQKAAGSAPSASSCKLVEMKLTRHIPPPDELKIELKLMMYSSCKLTLPENENIIFEENIHDRYIAWNERYKPKIEKIIATEIYKLNLNEIEKKNFDKVNSQDNFAIKHICNKFEQDFSSWEIVEPEPNDSRLLTPEKTWLTFKSALAEGDNKAAVMCLMGRAQTNLGELFLEMNIQELKNTASTFIKFALDNSENPNLRTGVLERLGGNAGIIQFTLYNGNWRISSM